MNAESLLGTRRCVRAPPLPGYPNGYPKLPRCAASVASVAAPMPDRLSPASFVRPASRPPRKGEHGWRRLVAVSATFSFSGCNKDGTAEFSGAIEGTRTPTPLRVHGPEPCASANSATMAISVAERFSRTAIQVGQQLVFYRGVAGCTNLPSMPVRTACG